MLQEPAEQNQASPPDVGPRCADVAIVGNGPAGMAAALALHEQGVEVVLIGRDIRRAVLGESLPPLATPLLQRLGVWAEFVASGHLPSYGNRSLWGAECPTEADFIRSPYGNGWHLDRDAFDRTLAKELCKKSIRVISSARVLECAHGTVRRWSLLVASPDGRQQLHADVVVDASGRARQVARMLGVDRIYYDRLIGIRGVLIPTVGAVDLDSHTEIEAVPDGWWYTSPLPDGRRVAVYLTDSDGDTCRIARTRGGWQMLLHQTRFLRARAAEYGYSLQGTVRCVSANSSRLERCTGVGWCAIGDAAAAFDPLSSQGIASALAGGLMAAHAIESTQDGALRTYEDAMHEAYARYMAQWLSYYALECHWSKRSFWRRRHQALQHVLDLSSPLQSDTSICENFGENHC